MKLLNRYNRTTSMVVLLVLFICSLGYYFIIQSILVHQTDIDLVVEEQEIVAYVAKFGSLPEPSDYKGQQTNFAVTGTGTAKRIFQSREIIDKADKKPVPVRQLVFSVMVSNVAYTATVTKLQTEAEDLLQLIFGVTAAIFLLLLLITFMLNRFVLKKIWQPFYTTLHQLQKFDLHKNSTLQLANSDIDEFVELNTSVSEMAGRVNNEYSALRNFTDNASHEMQTPLAVIQSKLDLLLQTSHSTQQEPIQALYEATARLSKLNQTLLLLTKIENQLYVHEQAVDFKQVIEKKLLQWEEIIHAANVTVNCHMQPTRVSLNGDLADILINNLLNNAIRHNIPGGTINVSLSTEGLAITNTGHPLTFQQSNIFNRFQKGAHSTGTGLGLAVVKQIGAVSNLTIAYNEKDGMHTIEVLF